MNIETKTASQRDIEDYEKFGWKHTEDVRRSRTTMHVLARDKDMPNHRLIAALEEKYFALKAKMKTYEKMSASTSFLLFLLLVVPFLLYWGFKFLQKRSINKHNEKLQVQMDAILNEVKPLL